MATISSVGIGSGVLTSDLIDQLAEAERAPSELRLNRKEEDVTAKLSEFGRLRSAITELRLPARVLSNPAAMQELTFNSTNSAFTGAVGSSASEGTYSLEVSKLAQSHSIATGTFVDKDTTTLGTGTLTIATGAQSVDISIDNSNNTLQGLADAINDESDLDVTATVIDNGSGFQLVITANNTGADNAISITAADDDGNDTDTSGISQLVFVSGGTENLTETVEAQDATMKLNGIDVTRSTNSFDDLIDGVELSLTNTNSGAPATITISRDAEAVADRLQDFVDKFNELKTIINEVTQYDPTKPDESGLLLGDSTVRSINQQTRELLSSVIPGLESASVRSLSEVGISTNKETQLIQFDRNAFIDAFEENTDDVVALFAEQGRTSDAQVEFVKSSVNTQPGTYDVNITQLATKGQFTGTADVSAGVTIDASNDEFTIDVNSVSSNSIVLTAGVYTADELVTEIQTQLNNDTALKSAGIAVTVALDGSNQLTFSSNTYGSNSTVNFSAVDTNTLATFGIDAINGTDGLDVAGTINGQVATGSGQQLSLTGIEDDARGIVLQIKGGTTGDRGSVTFIEGAGDRFVELFNNFLSVDGLLTTRTDGLTEQLNNIAIERDKLDLRVESLRERLVRQFTAADILVNKLNSTMEFVGKQLSALEPKSSS